MRLSNGFTWRHHQDQLQSCSETKPVTPKEFPETDLQDLLTAPLGYTTAELTDTVSASSVVSPEPVSARRYLEKT